MSPKRPFEDVDSGENESLVKRSLLSSSTSPKNSSLLTPSPSISITDPENSDVDSPSSRIVTSHGLAAGYISQVTMMNFMCHGHLTVDLGPGMNFIIGQNGSGKSTVLTAISTCLGGKASNTQRASSLKSFVKEGQSKAVVQVVFCNEGRGAYEFEKYGSSILIERSIIRDTGFSGYKIKDYKGKTISDKRKELDRILEAYRIQIDNPFAILTQDTARTFLTASSEKAKYDYFRRALLFDKIETYRDGTYDKLKLSEINLDHKQKELKEKAKEMEKWTHMYESMEMSSDAEKKINELSGLLYWNRVLELEKKISENELLINKTENEIQDIKKTHELLVERYAEADKALSEHEEKGAVLSSQYGDLNNKMQQAENEIDHIKNELKCHDEAKKNLLDNQKSIKDSIESIEDKIKSLRAKDDELYGNKREELENKKRELKDRIRKIGIEFNNLRSEEEQLMQKLSVFPSTLEPLHRRANEIDHLIKTETSTLRSLKNKQSDKLRAFGENFSSIMKDISASNKFSGHLPIGPIGSHITLKDPVWGSVLETILSRVLTGFIVENHDDRVILQNILDKYRARNPIFVRTLDRFDFKSSVPNKNHLTILDVLDIKDDNVKYLLIDFSIIERTILVKGRRKADDLMYNRPENVYRCLAIQPDNSTIAYSVGSRITGASKVEPITPWKDLPRMMTDTSFQIHTLNDSIEKNKSQKIEIEAEISSIRGKKSNIDQKIVEIKRTLSRLKAEQQSSEGQIDGIETELDVERDTTKLRELYATLDEQKEQLEQYEHQFVDLYDAKDEVQKRLQEAITRRQGIEKEKKVVRRSLQEHSRQRDILDEKRKTHALNRDSTSTDIAQMNHQIKQEREKLKMLQDKIDLYTDEAKEFSMDRLIMSSDQTPASVSAKIKELENIVNEYEKTCHLSFEEVVENAQKSSAEMADAQKSYDHLNALYESLSSTQESRYLMHQNVFERTKTEIKRNFKFNLQERGFNGSLEIDNSEGLLTMKIAPSSSENFQKQDVSTLSGGEKSFTQIALLVSIWQTMKSRILALDEFDVFMDKVNREISLKLVSESLARLNQTQSIFITPQDMDQSAIDLSDKNVRIFRMHPPVR